MVLRNPATPGPCATRQVPIGLQVKEKGFRLFVRAPVKIDDEAVMNSDISAGSYNIQPFPSAAVCQKRCTERSI